MNINLENFFLTDSNKVQKLISSNIFRQRKPVLNIFHKFVIDYQ